jgi:hypothetical protein
MYPVFESPLYHFFGPVIESYPVQHIIDYWAEHPCTVRIQKPDIQTLDFYSSCNPMIRPFKNQTKPLNSFLPFVYHSRNHDGKRKMAVG